MGMPSQQMKQTFLEGLNAFLVKAQETISGMFGNRQPEQESDANQGTVTEVDETTEVIESTAPKTIGASVSARQNEITPQRLKKRNEVLLELSEAERQARIERSLRAYLKFRD